MSGPTTVPTGFLTSTCRTALAAAIKAMPEMQAVPVHLYRREFRREADVATLCSDGSSIHGDQLSLRPNSPMLHEATGQYVTPGTSGGGIQRTTFNWQIEGFRSVTEGNASQTAWEDLIYLLTIHLNGYGLFAVQGLRRDGRCQVEEIAYNMLAKSILCHYARLSISLMGRTLGA